MSETLLVGAVHTPQGKSGGELAGADQTGALGVGVGHGIALSVERP